MLRQLLDHAGPLPHVELRGDLGIVNGTDGRGLQTRFYRELVARKGYERARIALLRKVFSVMHRMFLSRDHTALDGAEALRKEAGQLREGN